MKIYHLKNIKNRQIGIFWVELKNKMLRNIFSLSVKSVFFGLKELLAQKHNHSDPERGASFDRLQILWKGGGGLLEVVNLLSQLGPQALVASNHSQLKFEVSYG